MNAKAFRVSKWLCFALSSITTALFLIKEGGKITALSPELKLLLFVLGGVLAWLFNAAEQGLMRHYLFPLLGKQVAFTREQLPVLLLIPIFALDVATTRSGLVMAGFEKVVATATGAVLPWAFELFAELETRAEG